MKPLYPDVAWQPVKDALLNSSTIHLIAHVSPDSDTIGSQIALYHVLKSMGKDVWMHNVDVLPRICRYLEGSEKISHGSALLKQADTVVSVDAGSMGRLGMPKDYFLGKCLVNIDHHASNTMYGDVNLVDARYCATGAMIYDLILSMGMTLNTAMASAIYAAVLTDTASFRLGTVTADTHRMVGTLLDAGASSEQAAHEIYQNFRKERFDLLKHALGNLCMEHDGQTAWLHVPHTMYQETGMMAEDSEGFIDYARSISGVVIALFLREESVGEWKISMRGRTPYDVGALASRLGGGGHRYAAGCTLRGSFVSVQQQLYAAVSETLNG